MFILAAVVLAACMLAGKHALRSYRRETLKKAAGHLRYELLYTKLARDLRKGMNASEVEQIVGTPDNNDNQFVWVWVWPDDLRLSKDQTWRDLHSKSSSQLFLIFDKNRQLRTQMLKGVEADIDEELKRIIIDPKIVTTGDSHP